MLLLGAAGDEDFGSGTRRNVFQSFGTLFCLRLRFYRCCRIPQSWSAQAFRTPLDTDRWVGGVVCLMTVSEIHQWRGMRGGSGDVVVCVSPVCLEKEEEEVLRGPAWRCMHSSRLHTVGLGFNCL